MNSDRIKDEPAAQGGLAPERRAMRAGRLAAALAGLMLALPALAGSVSYAYDQLGRLATVTYSNGVVITYTYDASGNRSSVATTGVP